MIHEIHPHSFDNHYQAGKQILANDFVLHFEGRNLLLRSDADDFVLPQKKDFPQITEASESTFLFTLNGVSCFLVWDDLQANDADLVYTDINFFRSTKNQEVAWLSLVAFHLCTWYAEHQYCGKCGSKAQHKADERAMQCPACGTLYFPKISPAIIVAVTCKDKLLLARGSSLPNAWYSLIAGFVDVGETLEETVKREVKEEVGLDVRNIRYAISQPWPLSGSMMMGFIAEADDAQPIVVDGIEIAEAAWFERGSMPNHPPAEVGISGLLIEKFEKGEL